MNTEMRFFIAISDVVSIMNLTCGFLSIIMAINHDFVLSAIFMILSLIFDSSDGWVAHKTNRADEYGFGKNIDSLSDIISFGLAPAIFLYSYSTQILTIAVGLVIVICGVLRLARYNVISNEFTDFIGFPIPGIAIIISTFYLTGLFNIYIASILAIIISFAMICNKRYDKFSNSYLLTINGLCILLIILQIPLKIYNINIPALIVFLTSLIYLLINLIEG